MRFHNSEIPPANFPHLPLQHRVQRARETDVGCLWMMMRLLQEEIGGPFAPDSSQQGQRETLHLKLLCNSSTCPRPGMFTHTYTSHKYRITQPSPATCPNPLTSAYGAIPLLLSQAPIIESQVGINSRSCTWLGQKQLLRGGNVFFYTALHID